MIDNKNNYDKELNKARYLGNDTYDTKYSLPEVTVRPSHKDRSELLTRDIVKKNNEVGLQMLPFTLGLLGVGAGGALGGNTVLRAIVNNPFVKKTFNVVGTLDGIRNLSTNEGVAKTYRKFNEGDLAGAGLSALGDALDITGGIGLAKDIYKIFKYLPSGNNINNIFGKLENIPIKTTQISPTNITLNKKINHIPTELENIGDVGLTDVAPMLRKRVSSRDVYGKNLKNSKLLQNEDGSWTLTYTDPETGNTATGIINFSNNLNDGSKPVTTINIQNYHLTDAYPKMLKEFTKLIPDKTLFKIEGVEDYIKDSFTTISTMDRAPTFSSLFYTVPKDKANNYIISTLENELNNKPTSYPKVRDKLYSFVEKTKSKLNYKLGYPTNASKIYNPNSPTIYEAYNKYKESALSLDPNRSEKQILKDFLDKQTTSYRGVIADKSQLDVDSSILDKMSTELSSIYRKGADGMMTNQGLYSSTNVKVPEEYISMYKENPNSIGQVSTIKFTPDTELKTLEQYENQGINYNLLEYLRTIVHDKYIPKNGDINKTNEEINNILQNLGINWVERDYGRSMERAYFPKAKGKVDVLDRKSYSEKSNGPLLSNSAFDENIIKNSSEYITGPSFVFTDLDTKKASQLVQNFMVTLSKNENLTKIPKTFQTILDENLYSNNRRAAFNLLNKYRREGKFKWYDDRMNILKDKQVYPSEYFKNAEDEYYDYL